MIATAIYTGAPWEVLYRVHDVLRGRPVRGHATEAGVLPELVIARSLATGNVASFLPESLGLAPTPTPDRAEVLASIGMDQQIKAERARYADLPGMWEEADLIGGATDAAEMACGRTCQTCPAAALCHEGVDDEAPDIDMAEVALQLETGTAYLDGLV